MISMKKVRAAVVVAVLAMLAVSAVACKRPVRLVLTKDQQARIQDSIIPAAPSPAHVVNANFGDNLELVGVDLEPANPRPGQEVKLTWYWHSKRAVAAPGWKVFVHLELPKGKRMGLDHVPVGELYPMDQWVPGQYIKYVQTFKLDPKAEPGRAVLWAGIYSADVYGAKGSGERMIVVNRDTVKNDGDNRVSVVEFNVVRGVPEEKPPVLRLDVAPTPTPAITMDGAMDEEAWKGAATIGRLADAFGRPIDGEDQTSVRILQDGQFIYFGIAATDQSIEATLTGRDAELWTQDVFEIYLDGQMDGKEYLEIQVSPANVIFDALFAEHRTPEWKSASKHTVPGMETAVKVDGTLNVNGDRDRGWTMEVKIPASSIPGFSITEGAELRANFYRMNLQDGQLGRAHAWGPGGRDFHDLSKAGVLAFTTAVPVVEPKKN